MQVLPEHQSSAGTMSWLLSSKLLMREDRPLSSFLHTEQRTLLLIEPVSSLVASPLCRPICFLQVIAATQLLTWREMRKFNLIASKERVGYLKINIEHSLSKVSLNFWPQLPADQYIFFVIHCVTHTFQK